MALNAQGTQFRISEDGTTWIDIGCISGFSWDNPERASIDTTCLTDKEKSFKFGLRDSGTVSLDLRYEPQSAGQKMLEQSYASDKPYHFEIEYADTPDGGVNGTIKNFKGYVTTFSQSGAIDDIINGSVGIKVTGPVNETPPTV
jgi:hypothetical protein